MSENISITRIVDLPDADQGLGTNIYVPINNHPSPYGIPPPSGGIAPPQQTQTGPTQFPNTVYAPPNVPAPPPQLSQEQFNEMFTQHQARLPQRDIPMNIAEHVQDEQIQANYIPKPKLTADYIKEYQTTTDYKIREHEEKKLKEKQMANWFDELQTPIILALLYFIFQLPIINSLVFKKFSFLSIYRDDGNFNLTGLILKSLLFASAFYAFHKSIDMISSSSV